MHEGVGRSGAAEDVWTTFHCRVAALLSTMADGGNFALYVPAEEGEVDVVGVSCAPGFASGTVSSATFGNTTVEFDDAFVGLDLIGRCQALSDGIVDLVRDVHQLPDPGLLMVSAPDDLSARIGVLGLTDRAHVSADHVRIEPVEHRDVASAIWPASRDELDDVVLAHLRDHHDADVEPDEDGDFPLSIDDVRLWVKVAADHPTIIVGSPVVAEVRSVQRADTELNVLNRNSLWLRWYRRDRMVWQEMTVVARPFVPGQFDAMLAMFAEACAGTRLDLSDRLGAKVLR